VWSSTVLHIPVLEFRPPFALAYVDLDDGPRVLAHLREPRALTPGTAVCIEATPRGDLLAEPVTTEEPNR
jgi:uncharacterized OB-fold protein